MLKNTDQTSRLGSRAPVATALMLAMAALSGTVHAQGSARAAIPPVQPGVVGVWVDHTKQGAVEIRPCGDRICGYVVWMLKPVDDKTGRPITDALNPDAAKRNLPMCGLQIIGDAKPSRDGRGFESGWIYNPEDGVRYDVDVKPKSRDEILVHGFAGIRLLGETFTWTRAPDTLQKCKV